MRAVFEGPVPTKKEILHVLKDLNEEYRVGGKAFEIRESAGEFSLRSRPEYEKYIRKLFQSPPQKNKLSPSVLEVLTIIAYEQPITKAEIEAVRGVDCSRSLSVLLEKDLCSHEKKSPAPGNPSLYETTPAFLHYFGLKSLKELSKGKD